jgi:methionyl-tRNA synthetase
MVLTQKYFDGKVPQLGTLTDFDRATLDEMKEVKIKVEENLESYRFREALREAMNLARLGNKYLADTEPWKVIKTDEERVKTILNISLQVSANLAIVMEPFMPFTTEKLRKILTADSTMLRWDLLGSATLLPVGHKLGQPELLFEKVEDDAIAAQLQKLQKSKAENEAKAACANAKIPDMAALCSFDDFQKMDIRVVKILEAEKVAKSKKLIKMLVDTGFDKRTVVSGVAEHFEPTDLVGKQVSMLVNLAPRPIMGIESQGMILYAEDATGKLHLMQPQAEVNNGSKIC